MSLAQDSSFLRFNDGDVSIVVSSMRIYQLHSHVLRRNSSFFDREISKAAGAKLTKQARDQNLPAYRFELKSTSSNDLGQFHRRDVSDSGRAATNLFSLADLDNDRASGDSPKYWEWLFGSFYSKQPDFDDNNLATVVSGCMGLVDAAETIGSVEQVRETVDLALLRQDAVLWTSIAGNPAAWVELGCRIHSPTIFKESVCHLVGLWGRIGEAEKSQLEDAIRDLCQRKHNELELAKEAIEMRILGHYPPVLCRNAVAKPGRPSYANDIFMWMTICFCRQWYAQSLSADRTRKAADGGYTFYTALAKGGQAYLSHTDFRDFHQYFPMSSKACNVLEANMGVLKEDIKQFVKDLVVSRVHVDPEVVDWLTCAVVVKEDFPWYKPEQEMVESSMVGSVDGNDDLEEVRTPLLPRAIAGRGKKRAHGAGAGSGGRGWGTGLLSGNTMMGDESAYRGDDEY